MKTWKSMAAILSIVLVNASAWAGEFNTKPGDAAGNNVRFEITAPLETIVGTTSGVSGSFDFDPNDVKSSKGGTFTVDVSSFDSGIAVRDEHFRDNYLHTGQYPKATFTIDEVKSASAGKVEAGKSVELKLTGTLDMHGVKRQEEVTATISYVAGDANTAKYIMPGNIIGVNASFDVALADYGIDRPEALFLKVGEIVNIDLASRMSDAPCPNSAAGAAAVVVVAADAVVEAVAVAVTEQIPG